MSVWIRASALSLVLLVGGPYDGLRVRWQDDYSPSPQATLADGKEQNLFTAPRYIRWHAGEGSTCMSSQDEDEFEAFLSALPERDREECKRLGINSFEQLHVYEQKFGALFPSPKTGDSYLDEFIKYKAAEHGVTVAEYERWLDLWGRWRESAAQDTDSLKEVLEAGANVNQRGNEGETPLIEAVLYGSEASVRILLESGAEVNARDDYGKTALFYAVAKGRDNIASLLRKWGAVLGE